MGDLTSTQTFDPYSHRTKLLILQKAQIPEQKNPKKPKTHSDALLCLSESIPGYFLPVYPLVILNCIKSPVHILEFLLPGTCFLQLIHLSSTLPSGLNSSIICHWLSGSLSYLLPHCVKLLPLWTCLPRWLWNPPVYPSRWTSITWSVFIGWNRIFFAAVLFKHLFRRFFFLYYSFFGLLWGYVCP